MTWLQKLVLVGAVGALVFMGRVTYLGDHGVKDLMQLRVRLHEIVAENEKIAQDNKWLAVTVDRLKNDPAYIEDMARQTLKFVRKGDIVIEMANDDAQGRP